MKVEIGDATLYLGDCREVLPIVGTVDSVVTDPPYEIGFLGKQWDKTGVAFDQSAWRAVLAALRPGGNVLSFGATRTYHRMVAAIEDAGFEVRDQLQWIFGTGFPKGQNLKPAHEPIVLARSHGTAVPLNVDACRIPPGRWPTNVMHDGSPEVLELFPTTHGAGHAREAKREATGAGIFGIAGGDGHRFGDEGSVARFFYCPKASKRDRGAGNDHPTVKPFALMSYLCRLVTPKGGIVLDHCMGSGSTGVAAVMEGLRFVGIELEERSFEIACERISSHQGIQHEKP